MYSRLLNSSLMDGYAISCLWNIECSWSSTPPTRVLYSRVTWYAYLSYTLSLMSVNVHVHVHVCMYIHNILTFTEVVIEAVVEEVKLWWSHFLVHCCH